MARVPDVARRRFFSGTPLDTLNLFYTIVPFRKVWVQIAPTKPFTFLELLFFPLKTGKDQKKKKKGTHLRRATVFRRTLKFG